MMNVGCGLAPFKTRVAEASGNVKKCQEVVKVLDDFKWKRCEKDDPVQAELCCGRMVLAHRYCWAHFCHQGCKEQPMENPFENVGPKTTGKNRMGYFCYAFNHPSLRATVPRAFSSVEVYSLISLPLTRRP